MQLEKSIIFNLNKNLNLQLYLPNAIQFIEHVEWLRTKTSGKWHGPDKNINFCLAQTDSSTKWKGRNASMQMRKTLSKKNTDGKGGKTVEEIIRKEESLVCIPNETSHTGHKVREVNLILIFL